MTEIDATLDSLAARLGPEGWVTDDERRAPYEREWRGYWSGSCLGVARPDSAEAVAEVVRLAGNAAIPIVPHGGNTGLVAGGVPRGGIVLSTERMTAIRDIDRTNMTMTVDAGCILANIQHAAADVGLYFPLSLGAEGSCRIGGNISTNAGGVAVLRYGNMRDLVLGLEAVLPDGRIWDGLRALRKDNTGYDLKQLFIGAEGTLGVVTGAVLKLFPAIRETVTALAAVNSWEDALDLLNRLQAAGGNALSACEAISREALDVAFEHIPDVDDPFRAPHPLYVLLELTSPRDASGLYELAERELAHALEDGVAVDIVVAQSEAQRAALWRLREAVPEAQPKAGGSIKHDIAVPVSAVPGFVKRADSYARERLPGVRVIAFGHLGDGNLHYNLSQPVGTGKSAFLAHWDEVTGAIHDIAASFGGSFSAEHGIGEIKRTELSRLRSATEIDLMRKIKRAIDPANIMNPGKIIPD